LSTISSNIKCHKIEGIWFIIESKIKENYVLANGINTYYVEQGAGYPIILLHGGMGTANGFQNLIPELAKKFQVIAPDCRGHGKSDNPSGEFSYKLMADDIAEFIKILKLERPLICGVSDGGQIAFELALNYSELIKAIIVTGVLIEISEDYIKNSMEGGLIKPGVVDFTQFEKMLGDFLPIFSKAYSPVYGPDYWKTFVQEMSKVWLNPKEFPREKIKDITLPVLNVQGDRDNLIPIEEALRIYRLIPHSELAVAPNSVHIFPHTNWELFLALISDFLQRNGKND